MAAVSLQAPQQPVQSYYQSKVDELELVVREKAQNLARLTAQRNELNGRVRLLREELYALQEVRMPHIARMNARGSALTRPCST